MPAMCRCKNGHTFTSRVLEDDYTINSFVVADDSCPECGTDDFEVTGYEADDVD